MDKTLKKILFHGIVPAAILAAPFFLPSYQAPFDVGTLLTVVSLLFTILVGFFIATATTNYLNLRGLVADEDAGLMTLYNLGSLVQPSQKERIADAIDRYAIATFDYPIMDYIDKTVCEFDEVIAVVDSLRPEDEDKRRVAALTYLHESVSNLYKARQAITLAAPRIVSGLHWFIIISLTTLTFILLFTLQVEHPLSALATGILSLAMYLILLLIYEIDGDVFLEEQLAYESSQHIFHTIGRLPYYPATIIAEGRVKKPKGRYRVGVYKNYPASLEKDIRVAEE